MTNRAAASACVLALAMITGALPTISPQSPAPTILKPQKKGVRANISIGVIDVGKAINAYPAYIKLSAELKKSVTGYQEQLESSQKKLETLRATIRSMEDEAPERNLWEHNYKKALQDQDFLRKQFSDQFADAESRMMLRVYEDLDYAVNKVARKLGVALVLPKRDIAPSPAPIAKTPVRELQNRSTAFRNRQVWFAANQLDITDAVIKYMMAPLPNRIPSQPAETPGVIRK